MDFQVMVVMPNCQLAAAYNPWTRAARQAPGEDEYRGIIVLPRGQYKPELD